MTKDELKEIFGFEFEKTCDLIKDRFKNKDGIEREIAGTIIINYLHKVQSDLENMNFINFHKKYLSSSLFLDKDDFTKSQCEKIISETRLTEDERMIAKLIVLENMKPADAASRVYKDKRTVEKDWNEISKALKETSRKIDLDV